jgi:hypothetical protein
MADPRHKIPTLQVVVRPHIGAFCSYLVATWPTSGDRRYPWAEVCLNLSTVRPEDSNEAVIAAVRRAVMSYPRTSAKADWSSVQVKVVR